MLRYSPGAASRRSLRPILSDLELRGEEVFGLALVQRAAREQFSPVLMTAVAAGLALLPIVYFGAVAGLEIIHSMAVVVLCGLVVSILFNLFILPTLYLSFGTTPEPEMRFEGADFRVRPMLRNNVRGRGPAIAAGISMLVIATTVVGATEQAGRQSRDDSGV